MHDALADEVGEPGLRDAERAGGDRRCAIMPRTSSVSSAVSLLRDRVVEDSRSRNGEITPSAAEDDEREHDQQPRRDRA